MLPQLYRHRWMDEDIEAFREQVRRYIAGELAPHVEDWRRQGYIPREVWRPFGQMGFMLPELAEEYGGSGASLAYQLVVQDELAKAEICANTGVHNLAAHYILDYGTKAQKERWLPRMASGELLAGIALTEPGCGSDLKALRTRARREGDDYVIDGAKTFITNGFTANLLVVAVRTGDSGSRGVSLVVLAQREGRRGLPSTDEPALVRASVHLCAGPGPLAGRMLADMGAVVTVIVRPGQGLMANEPGASGDNPLRRGKTMVMLDLKQESDRAEAMTLVAAADALIEGNRPGVMERLGLGPADCAAHNPKLIYGRMTGWGQSGSLSQAAGHDLNYVALTGLLSLSAHRGERPVVPPTVVGDAAGALGLAFGIACALLDARTSGRGRVVDGAIVDIVAMLGGIAQLTRARGWLDSAGLNLFHDSPFLRRLSVCRRRLHYAGRHRAAVLCLAAAQTRF